jgi:hypothetical protein
MVVCEYMAAYNFDWAELNHVLFNSTLTALGDVGFADRLAIHSNKVPALQTTDMLIQTSMSPVTRVGERITYYGPDSEEETEVFATELPLTYVVQSTSETFVSGESTTAKFGYVYDAAETFNISDYESTNGLFPPSPNMKLTYTLPDTPLKTIEWKEPWGGTPTVTQIASAATAALGTIGASHQSEWHSLLPFWSIMR